MLKKIGSTNIHKRKLISELSKSKAPFWKRIAYELNRSLRKGREVNLSLINKHSEAGETIIVPGKVLGNGEIQKKITLVAWRISKQAETKIKNAKGSVLSIPEFAKKNPKGTGVKIIG